MNNDFHPSCAIFSSCMFYAAINCVIFSLQEHGFPVHVLPKVVSAGDLAGSTQENWYGIPAGTPVGAALGDMQCSILSASPKQNDAGMSDKYTDVKAILFLDPSI